VGHAGRGAGGVLKNLRFRCGVVRAYVCSVFWPLLCEKFSEIQLKSIITLRDRQGTYRPEYNEDILWDESISVSYGQIELMQLG
jgi:hypothetical protein